MSLSEFITTVKNKGLARPNRFEVSINLPKILDPSNNKQTPSNWRGFAKNNNYSDMSSLRDYVFYCDTAALPGASFSTDNATPYGELRDVPTNRVYDQIQLSFYVDSDYKVKKFFDCWTNAIIHPITRNHAYYNEYTTTISINMHNEESNHTYRMDLYECYPKTIGSVQLDYADGSIMKLQVQIQYKNFRVFDYKSESYLGDGIQEAEPIILGQKSLLNGELYDTNPTAVLVNGTWHNYTGNPDDPNRVK